MFISNTMPKINIIQLTFKEIADKIDAGFFDEVSSFPQIPSVSLCLNHSRQLQNTCMDIFPEINYPQYLKPSIYAISFILLLRTCNLELYKKCTHVTDIWTALRDEDVNHIHYDINDTMTLLRTDADDKFWCTCGQRIEKLFMCSANGNFLILGSVCIEKTEIKSLLEKLKELKKILCDSCNLLKNPSSVDSNICSPCSKKTTCTVCNLFTKPSKLNKYLCSGCYKHHHKCQLCPKYCYIFSKNCNSCNIKIQEQHRLEQIEIDEQNRLKQIEINEQRRLKQIEIDEQRRLKQIEIDEHNEQRRLKQIEIDEQRRLKQIEIDEQRRLEQIEQIELKRLRHIEIEKQDRLRKIEINKNIYQWRQDGLTTMKCMDCNTDITISTWSIRCTPCWKLIQ